MTINAKHAEVLIQQLGMLVVDDNPFMRKMVRSMLNNISVTKTLEAVLRPKADFTDAPPLAA